MHVRDLDSTGRTALVTGGGRGIGRHMKGAGGGSIIHVSSLTLDMAVKLAPHGIRVNAIAPGPFFTDLMNHVRHDPERLARFHEQVPQRRSGGEDDIKGAAVFLGSAAAAFVTGHTLVVDGGTLAC